MINIFIKIIIFNKIFIKSFLFKECVVATIIEDLTIINYKNEKRNCKKFSF
jgi:hypothetical protein